MTNKKQLLLVEDDVFSAETLKYALEAKGHEVIMATNGSDALSIVRKKSPQLILLDIMMPKMDGYHFCRLIKFDTRFKHIPVIIVSSKIQEADKKLGFTCGGDEYITKPYDIDHLVNLVGKYLESIQVGTTQTPNQGETYQSGTTPMPDQGETYRGDMTSTSNQSETYQGGMTSTPNQDETYQGGTMQTPDPEGGFQRSKVQTMLPGETFVIGDNAKITVLNIDREQVKLCFNDSDPVTLFLHESKSMKEDIIIKILKIDAELIDLEVTVSDNVERSKKWYF
ncbi:MAG: response regulator [Planctomycetota bacterium]|jgi:DNA-binding response OmpR family regulator